MARERRHGTRYCRMAGCERPECIEAANAYARERRSRLRAVGLPPGDARHGTPIGYRDYGCRDRDCNPGGPSCTDAHLADKRKGEAA
ncbi:MAG: hypothetical protein AAFZ07_25745 [Actinomycetota bacterium]